MSRTTTRLVAAAGCALSACALAATPPGTHTSSIVEVSEDGRLVVEFERDLREPSVHVTTRGGDAPYPLVPDQEVMLRRQVGGVAIADMDGDGNNDVVACVYISNSFPPYTEFQDMIFYGTGAGINTIPGWVSNDATHSADVLIGDLNNDSFNDVVVVHGGGLRTDNVRVYFGSMSGPSTAAGFVSTSSPNAWGTAGALVDIDNDNDLDLVTTNQGTSTSPDRPVMLFRNDGSTLLATNVWSSTESNSQSGVDAADINGDGFMDLAVARRTSDASCVYLNTGAGLPEGIPSVTVPPDPSFPGGTDDRGAVFADFTMNGVKDLFFNSRTDHGRLYTVTPTTLTLYQETTPPFDSPQETRVADVDGDGDMDLAEIHFSDGRTHIYINRNGVLDGTPTWTYDASEVGNSLAFGDLNNDGRPDLVTGYGGDICLRVFFAVVPDCPGDLTTTGGGAPGVPDGSVDLADLLYFVNAWDADLGSPTPNPGSIADVTTTGGGDPGVPDGNVDLSDLLYYVNDWEVGLAQCP